MIKNANNKLYIGVTANLYNRLSYHNTARRAAFTKYCKDFKTVFSEKYGTLAEARKREIQIKK